MNTVLDDKEKRKGVVTQPGVVAPVFWHSLSNQLMCLVVNDLLRLRICL